MKIRRITSLLLVLCVLMTSVNITAFASANETSNGKNTNYSTADELTKIEAEREMLYDNIRNQLALQNALDKFEQFKFIADNEINMKYYPQSHAARASYYAPRGGNVTSKDGTLTSVAEYMTAANAASAYQSSKGGYSTFVRDLSLVGIGIKWTLPGAIISAAVICQSFANEQMWGNVKIGTDNVIVYSVHDANEGRATTVIAKWSGYSYMSDAYSLRKNIAYQAY